jgi:DNA-binding beta-propeller fold protein YncE
MIRHILISLLVLVILSSCAAPPQVPDGYWEGLVQEGNSSYPIRLTFENCTEGSACVEVDYPNFGCGGKLIFQGAEASQLTFIEIIEYGQDQCISGATVKAKYEGDADTMSLGWFGPDGSQGPTAAIRRVAEPGTQAVSPSLPTNPAPTATLPVPTPVIIEGFGEEVAAFYGGWMITWLPVIGFDSLWIASGNKGTVERIDMKTNQVVASIPVGKPARADFGVDPLSVAVSEDSVWVTLRGEKALGRIDPSTNQLVERIPIEIQAYDIAVDGDTLWVTAFEERAVARVDITSGQVVAVIEVPNPSGIAVGGGAVWAVERRKGALARIDPASNSVVAEIKLGPEGAVDMYPQNVVYAFDSVWVADQHGKTISRIDPATNQKILIRFPMSVSLVSAGGGYIWASLIHDDPSKNGIARIDPATNEVIETVTFPGVISAVYFEGELWITDNGFEKNRRMGDVAHRIRLEP